MKYRTEVVRDGELLGPVDWSYDFRGMFNSFGLNDKRRDERCECAKATLKDVEEILGSGRRCIVTKDSGYSYEAYAVGMYDGWPFWKPTPAVLHRSGPLGGSEWSFFYELANARDADNAGATHDT